MGVGRMGSIFPSDRTIIPPSSLLFHTNNKHHFFPRKKLILSNKLETLTQGLFRGLFYLYLLSRHDFLIILQSDIVLAFRCW